MPSERPTVAKLNEKFLILSQKIGLEPDLMTRNGNGMLGKLESLLEIQKKITEEQQALKKELLQVQENQKDILKFLATDNVSRADIREFLSKSWAWVIKRAWWLMGALAYAGFITEKRFGWLKIIFDLFR